MDLYQKIAREYEKIRADNQQEQERRKAKIYRQIPQIKKIDEMIRTLGFQGSIEQIKHPNPDAALALSEEIFQLKLQKQHLLEKQGYPKDYLEPIYTCPICRDRGHTEEGKKCSCMERKISYALYDLSNISYILQKENFNTFDLNRFSETVDLQEGISPKENMRQILETIRRFMETFSSSNDFNMLFYGPTGQGKTFLLNCIAKELMDHNVNVIYQTAFEVVELLELKKFQHDTLAIEKNELLFSCDLLIIDDLGIECSNSFTNTEIFNIINTRLLRGKKTLISTNLSPKELSNTYTDRVFSRVFQKFVPIKFFGEDLRWQ